MINPFDLGTYDFPTVNIDDVHSDFAMDKAISTQVPYLDIELPSTDVVLPTPRIQTNPLNSYLPQTTTPQDTKKKEADYNDSLYNELVNTKFKSDRVAYSYSAAMDVKYDKLDYNPNKDMDKIYDENQSTWDVFKKQTDRLVLNAKNTFRDGYIGDGRLVHNLGTAEFGKLNNSHFNQSETLASYLSSINEEFYNPIHGKEDASWYSMKGWLGDTYASSGFALGAITKGVVDYTIGKGLRAVVTTPIGAAAVGLGVAALFNDSVRDYIGEENANFTLGLITGGATSSLLTTGINKLTKAIPPTSIPVFKQALTDFKQSKDFGKSMRGVIDNTLSNIKSGTLLDASTDIAKQVKIDNTVNKGLTAGLTTAKMYLSSGAESGMEAIQAQYDYIGEKMKEAQDKGTSLSEEEYLKVYNDGLGMAKDVYNMNRVILGASNYSQFGDIITGKFVRNKSADLGLEYVKGQSIVEVVGSPLKSWYKHQLKDSLWEGVEEGSQYVISEGSKDYLKNREHNKSKFDSFMYGVQQTLTTSQGWGNIMSGIFSSLVPGSASNIVRGISEANKGGKFLSGFTGFDKQKAEFMATQLNQNFKSLYDNTINSKNMDTLLKFDKWGYDVNNQLSNQRIKIEQTLFDSAISSIESGNSENIKYFIEDYFTKNTENPESSANYDRLIKLYGSEDNVQSAKVEILDKINKAESTVKSFQEFYNNPYTVSTIDSLFDNKLGRKLGIKSNSKEATQIKAGMYNSMVVGAARAFYLHGEYSNELLKAREVLKSLTDELITNNSELPAIDLTSYLAGNRNTYTDLLNDIDTQIEAIKITQTDGSILSDAQDTRLVELEALKLKLRDEEGLKYEQALKSNDKASQEYLSQNTTPLLKLIGDMWESKANDKGSNPIFKQVKRDTVKKVIMDIQHLEDSIFFLSKDLKSFTSEKEQKILIDYLYNIRTELDLNANKKIEESKKIEDKKKEDIDNAKAVAKNTSPKTPSEILATVQSPKNDPKPEDNKSNTDNHINIGGTKYSIIDDKVEFEENETVREIPVTNTQLTAILDDIKRREIKELSNLPKDNSIPVSINDNFDKVNILQKLLDNGVSIEKVNLISEYIDKLQNLYDKNLEDITSSSNPLKFEVTLNQNLQSYDPSVDNVIEGDTRKKVEDKLFDTYKYLLEKVSNYIINPTTDTKSESRDQNKLTIDQRLQELWKVIYRDKLKVDLDEGFANTKGFNDAISVGSDTYSSHGMGKSGLGSALNDLIKLLTNGIDKNRGSGRLYTAGLTNSSGASDGSTAGGNSYRDGSFILVAKKGEAANGITDINQVGGILVNNGITDHYPELLDLLREKFPNLVIESYTNTKKLIQELNNQSNSNVSESIENKDLQTQIDELKSQDTTNISAEDSLRIRTSENNKKKLIEDLLFPSKEKETKLKTSITRQVNLGYYEVDFSEDFEDNKEIIEFLNEHAKSKNFKFENNNNVITIWSVKGRPEHLNKPQVVKRVVSQVDSTSIANDETIIEPPLITFLNNYTPETTAITPTTTGTLTVEVTDKEIDSFLGEGDYFKEGATLYETYNRLSQEDVQSFFMKDLEYMVEIFNNATDDEWDSKISELDTQIRESVKKYLTNKKQPPIAPKIDNSKKRIEIKEKYNKETKQIKEAFQSATESQPSNVVAQMTASNQDDNYIKLAKLTEELGEVTVQCS